MPTDPIMPPASGFPADADAAGPAGEARWRAAVAAVLRRSGYAAPDPTADAASDTGPSGGDPSGDTDPTGASDPIGALSTRTYDDIALRPLYTAAPAEPIGLPGVAPFRRGATADGATLAGWDVRVQLNAPDAESARTAALADLENGATSLWLRLGAGGLPVADLAAALDGVYVELAPVALDAGAETEAAASAYLNLVHDRSVRGDIDAHEIRGTLGADPIGVRARTGTPADLGVLGRLAQQARGYPNLHVATVDATIYHDAGASDADEIGIATAVGVAYLRALADAGLAVEDALAAVGFRFAVTAEQFASIAKLRAARQIWGRVAELCGATGQTAASQTATEQTATEQGRLRGQWQHAVTSAAMLTRHDPWVNLLRTTIGCVAAAVGGADAITVLPFDYILGLPDGFARRIARNTQAILHDESGLGRVLDPAGGSYYVETLTSELAQRAWDAFTAIERDGGASAMFDSEALSERIAATRRRRLNDIAHRRAPITGVTEFALPDEPLPDRSPAPAVPDGGPLVPYRWAEEFENLRDSVAGTTPRPSIYLATLGPLAAHSARLGFATNLFNAGGLRVITGPVGDFAASGATVACLCSSDAVHADEASDAADALKAAGAKHVWLAGKLTQAESPDVDGYLFAGCDTLAVLTVTIDAQTVAAQTVHTMDAPIRQEQQ